MCVSVFDECLSFCLFRRKDGWSVLLVNAVRVVWRGEQGWGGPVEGERGVGRQEGGGHRGGTGRGNEGRCFFFFFGSSLFFLGVAGVA